jgi:serine/threonine protein phosphatase 1
MITFPTQIEGPFAVIGDTHGQDHLLEPLLEKLFATPGFEERWLVFVGDFVDRGPNPRRVVEIVLDLIQNRPKTTAIMGNHELAMIAAMDLVDTPSGRDSADIYLTCYSAETTIESYDAEFDNLVSLRDAMPAAHKQFFMNLPWCVHHPHNMIVHAGLLFDQPYEQQLEALRKRDFNQEFPPWLCRHELASTPVPTDCPKTVISGHVPLPNVFMTDNRILLDTSGGLGDTLSAVLIPEREIIQHMHPPAES